jgi:hypothetical protein
LVKKLGNAAEQEGVTVRHGGTPSLDGAGLKKIRTADEEFCRVVFAWRYVGENEGG